MSILVYRNSADQVYKISLEEFEKRVGIEYVDTLLFEKDKYREKLAKKSQRKLKRHSVSQKNNWTLALHQQAMESPKEDLFYVRWINNYLGYGVFAAQDIPALCYIGEYTGVVCKRGFRKSRFNDYVFGYVAAGSSTPYIIDAKKQGNFTRFINHSDQPNLTSRWIVKEGLTHIILFANKLIPKDKQLTYDYGKYYWRSRAHPSLIT